MMLSIKPGALSWCGSPKRKTGGIDLQEMGTVTLPVGTHTPTTIRGNTRRRDGLCRSRTCDDAGMTGRHVQVAAASVIPAPPT